MKLEIIPHEFQIDDQSQLVIPHGMTQESWAENHAKLIRAAKCCRQWLDKSRAYGIENYGEEAVTQTEHQTLLALGINLPPPKPNVNGEGKARGIASIEGISQGFQIWRRTVDHLIPTWKPEQIKRALELLHPIEEEAKRLRSILSGKTP